MKNIYLLVGPSGSGKTTLAQRMAEFYGMKVVQSYTTRPPRYEGEVGHIFVSDEEFDQLGKMVAYTEYGGYRYGVTQEIVDTYDIYVIDPYGVSYLQSQYTGPKIPIVVWLSATEEQRREHMKHRGDSEEAIQHRLLLDRKEFDHGAYDFVPDLVLPATNRGGRGLAAKADLLATYIRYLEEFC